MHYAIPLRRDNIVTMESLRDEQKRIARDRIVDALATEIAENGLRDLSMSAIAERAGVSLRTVYNHFETKDVLVAALNDWAEEWIDHRGGPLVLSDIDEIPEALVTNAKLFEEMGYIAIALARIRSDALLLMDVTQRYGEGHAKRTEAMRIALGAIRPELDEDELNSMTAIFRLLMGFDSWNLLTHEHGLGGADAGRVMAWSFSAMLESVRKGEGPYV